MSQQLPPGIAPTTPLGHRALRRSLHRLERQHALCWLLELYREGDETISQLAIGVVRMWRSRGQLELPALRWLWSRTVDADVHVRRHSKLIVDELSRRQLP